MLSTRFSAIAFRQSVHISAGAKSPWPYNLGQTTHYNLKIKILLRIIILEIKIFVAGWDLARSLAALKGTDLTDSEAGFSNLDFGHGFGKLENNNYNLNDVGLNLDKDAAQWRDENMRNEFHDLCHKMVFPTHKIDTISWIAICKR